MPTLVTLTVSLSLILLSTESYKTYVTPNMTWTKAFTYCRQDNSGRLATFTTAEWKERGTPPDLPFNTWVWIGALFLESHTWNPFGGNEADLLEHVGCYEVSDISGARQYKNVEGPPECHRKCGRQHPGGHMYLKDNQCYCLPSSQLPSSHFRVESRMCDVICQKSFHWCGGNEHLYSVYALSRGLRINDDASWEGPCFLGKFDVSEEQTWTLQIKNSSCDANETTFCVFLNKTVSLVKASSFQEVSRHCEAMNSCLPLTFDSVSNKSVDFSSYRKNGTGGHSVPATSFWLNLKRSESPYWIDGKLFKEPNITRSTARCVAMRVTSDGSVAFYATPCTTSLPALCSDNDEHQEQGSRVVIIAGVAGAGVLLTVCLLTVLLACLKRHGQRRSTRNTSRNSDVSLGERQDSLHGQRSDAGNKVHQSGSEMSTFSPKALEHTYANHSPSHDVVHQENFGWFKPAGNPTDGQSKCLARSSRDDTTMDAAAQDDGRHLQEGADAIYTNVNSLSSGEMFSHDHAHLQADHFAEGVFEVSPTATASRDLKDNPHAQPHPGIQIRAKGHSRQLYVCLLFKI